MATPTVTFKFDDPVEPPTPTSRSGPSSSSVLEEGGPRTIFEAAERGLVGYIVKQVERNIEYDINQRDKYQRTAVHWAAEAGHVEVIEALMDYGADVTLIECNGRTAFHLAAREGHAEALAALSENMDDAKREEMANMSDHHGISPVFLSLQRGEETLDAFKFLMEKCGGKYNQTAMPKKSESGAAKK